MADRFDLDRFVKAQDPVLPQVLVELATGQKLTHWMWFVFPQLAGLGKSICSQNYALASIDEAKGYFAHKVLGPRLIECTALVNSLEGRSVHQIFGKPDYLKFHSSMTLFALAQPEEPSFLAALRKYFDNSLDQLTIKNLG